MKDFVLFKKEIKDLLKNKSSVFYFLILFATITYSFYSAVDLYSKASIAAVNNPLYASGFEPVPGVFVPTFGGVFIIFSLLLPFLLIRIFGVEKANNTISLILQLDFSEFRIFLSKVCSGVFFVLLSLISLFPLLFIWDKLGGHIAWGEFSLLFSGYFLYGIFILSVSVLSSILFKTNAQASIFAIALIVFSWFIDFGKDMHLFSFLDKISDWSVTNQLKEFEKGIFSIQSILYFLLTSFLLFSLAFIFFNINIRKKVSSSLLILLLFTILLSLNTLFQYKVDITESGKHSFSKGEIEFLKNLPEIKIKVYLEPTDSRFKDYENDFLEKLKMVKRDFKVIFAKGKELRENYGLFKYSLNGKTAETYSNSANEIFLILEELSGKKIKKGKGKERNYKGYPLVVKKGWSKLLILIYLFLLPVSVFLIKIKKPRRIKK